MPSIHNSTIERVQSLDILEVLIQYLPDLKKTGKNWVCKSPFKEENTPSFTVFPNTQSFKCFSSGIGGDAIEYVKQKENLNFPEAIKHICQTMGITVEYGDETPEQATKRQQQAEHKQQIKAALIHAQHYFTSHELPKTPKSKTWNKAIIEKFGIGYAPEAVGGLGIPHQNISLETLQKADLVCYIDKKDKYYDKFRNRFTLPTYDHLGNIVGFTGRDANPSGDKKYKYLYSNSNVWTKGNYVYALHLAKDAIRKMGFAYIVEGQTDVIALHRKSKENTVGIGSSTLSEAQIKQLLKYTKSFCIIPDNDLEKEDNPGIKALHKNAVALYQHGAEEVRVLIPGNPQEKKSYDPEEWINAHSAQDKQEILQTWFSASSDFITDYLLNGLKIQASKSILEKKKAIEAMNHAINSIENTEIRELTEQEVTKLWKDFKRKKQEEQKEQTYNNVSKGIEMTRTEYFDSRGNKYNVRIPKGLDYATVHDFFMKHNYFEFENRVWTGKENYRKGESDIRFYHCSNFVWESLFHLNDNEFSKRVVKLTNIHGHEIVQDVRTDDIATPSGFIKFGKRCGNFLWKDISALFHVEEYQFAKEEFGISVDILGHHKSGFFIFSNGAYSYSDQKFYSASKNGVVKINGKSYYVASGNSVYAENDLLYQSEKCFIYKQGKINFSEWCSLYIGAYNQNALPLCMLGILAVFSDVVHKVNSSVPILFLYGVGGTAKGSIIKRLMAFFGEQRQPLKLSSKGNTIKGVIRSLAQYSNTPLFMDEYVNDETLDEFLKATYDRDGYTRAVKDSKFGTETTPCLSTSMVTGNQEPTDGPTLSRCVFIEMNTQEFTQSQTDSYNQMVDHETLGVGQVLTEILSHRKHFETVYKQKNREAQEEINRRYKTTLKEQRVLNIIAQLVSCYDSLTGLLPFPFDRESLIEILVLLAQKLLIKIDEGSEVSKFFIVLQDLYKTSQISDGNDYKLKDGQIALRMGTIYATYAKAYSMMFRGKRPPSKTTLFTKMKLDPRFIEQKDGYKFGKDVQGKMINSSAMIFDYDAINFELWNVEKEHQAETTEI